MKPLDDELRAVLSSRADSLPLVPDPIVGIERRARRMRRNRVAAAVAATALAVTAIAVAVPALTSSSTESLPEYATPTPTVTAEPSAVAASPYALDPANPWPYRGTPVAELGTGTIETIKREYVVRHGADKSSVSLTPLFGQVDEPSQQAVVVFVAQVKGEHRWGVAQGSEGGPAFLVDASLPPGTTALPVTLPGDEVGRLLVTAAPGVEEIQYGYDRATEWISMTTVAPGVAVTPLEGDPADDRVRVLSPEGEVVFESLAPDVVLEAAPDPAAPTEDGGNTGDDDEHYVGGAPTNVVDWPTRGLVDNELYLQALRAYEREFGYDEGDAEAKVLYAGSREGRNIMLLQVWGEGFDARTFGYVEAAGNETTFVGDYTAPGPAAFGLLIPAETAFLPDDLLLVVPEPAAGQVLYSADGSSEPKPVADQGTEAAVLIERAPGASGDRLLVLDGNGDPDRPILRGTVADLLAAF